MIEVTTREDCNGCGVCAEHCPRRCISLVTDETGWRHPVVNTDFCLNCGICDNVCPVLIQRAIASGNFFDTAFREEPAPEPRHDEKPDMRGLLFDLGEYGIGGGGNKNTHPFITGDCILTPYGPNAEGRLFKIRDGAGDIKK